MLNNVASMITNIFQPLSTPQVRTIAAPVTYENPFASAPFITVQSRRQNFHGKNTPVTGGYFAGYHNGKQNIVGRKLFVNV